MLNAKLDHHCSIHNIKITSFLELYILILILRLNIVFLKWMKGFMRQFRNRKKLEDSGGKPHLIFVNLSL